jgi:hypothetical protein
VDGVAYQPGVGYTLVDLACMRSRWRVEDEHAVEELDLSLLSSRHSWKRDENHVAGYVVVADEGGMHHLQ